MAIAESQSGESLVVISPVLFTQDRGTKQQRRVWESNPIAYASPPAAYKAAAPPKTRDTRRVCTSTLNPIVREDGKQRGEQLQLLALFF